MPAFRWQRRKSRFAEWTWVPVVYFRIRDANGHFRRYSFHLDSGAIVSLPGSAARQLGISLESGRPSNLHAVGGSGNPVFVHDLPVRCEDGPIVTIPIAFSPSEDVPNLLGRLGVFDRYRIEFDPIQHETRMHLVS